MTNVQMFEDVRKRINVGQTLEFVRYAYSRLGEDTELLPFFFSVHLYGGKKIVPMVLASLEYLDAKPDHFISEKEWNERIYPAIREDMKAGTWNANTGTGPTLDSLL